MCSSMEKKHRHSADSTHESPRRRRERSHGNGITLSVGSSIAPVSRTRNFSTKSSPPARRQSHLAGGPAARPRRRGRGQIRRSFARDKATCSAVATRRFPRSHTDDYSNGRRWASHFLLALGRVWAARDCETTGSNEKPHSLKVQMMSTVEHSAELPDSSLPTLSRR
jgi:hypothetical protein